WGAAVVVDDDVGLALEDDEKAAAGHSPAQHPLALGKELLADRVRDFLQARLCQVREQRQLRERLDDLPRFRRHTCKRNPAAKRKLLELVGMAERVISGVLALEGNFASSLSMRLGPSVS